jgi:hypothetical protein
MLVHPTAGLRNPKGSRAATAYPLGTWVNDTRYGGKLDNAGGGDLLEMISHEGVHWDMGTKGKSDSPDNQDVNGKGYPYDQGRERTKKKVRNDFNNYRKQRCGCE